MKSKFNPTQYMLIAYKESMGTIYEKSFLSNCPELNEIKLKSFCNSLVSLMRYKGFNYYLNETDDKIDVFCDSTLILTYDYSIIKNIHSETSLKFQLFCEWGLLQELTSKKMCLVAM